jgi:hypothetical protein
VRIQCQPSKLKQLQHKMVGKGVQIENKTFQSFENVQIWVHAHLPTYHYGLFFDGASLFEFFSAGHIDAEIHLKHCLPCQIVIAGT